MIPTWFSNPKGALSLVLLLLLAVGLFSAPEYWSSDEAAFPIERLASRPAHPASDYYWLEIDRSGKGETRRLYLGGEEKRRVEVLPGQPGGGRIERTWESDILVDEIEYGKAGEILRESSWSASEPDKPLWVETYSYENGRLSKVSRSGPEESGNGSRSYTYDPDGHLLSVELAGYYGASDIGSLPGLSLPRALWSERDDSTMRIELFDPRGNVSSARLVKDGAILVLESFSYDGNGHLVSSRTKDSRDGSQIDSTYDKAGRLASTTTTDKTGRLGEKRLFSWDDSGNLILETRSFPPPVLTISRSWDSKGHLVKEERSEDGELVLVTTWEAGEVRIEESWYHGQAVVRTRYEGGIKVREDFLENGLVVRTRSFP